MPVRLVLAALHLLALAVGPAAVWSRARSLREALRAPGDGTAFRRAMAADLWWGIAAALWLVTGLWRFLAGTEKATSYYMANHLFYAKMGLFLAVVAMEVWPMMTLLRWRTGRREPTPRDIGRIEAISYVECAAVIAMMVLAVSMSRGYGMRSAIATTANSTLGPSDTTRSANPATVNDTLIGIGEPVDSTTIAPTGTSVPTPEDLELLSRELIMPLAGVDAMKLHSNFNERRGGNRAHEALDIMAPRRTPVVAAAKGRVLKLFTSRAGGLMVYAADSSERFILMYAHLDGYAPGLRDGARVERGQLLGYVGFTGNASASAPHLHFALARSADVKHWSSGTPVDPLPLLQRAR